MTIGEMLVDPPCVEVGEEQSLLSLAASQRLHGIHGDTGVAMDTRSLVACRVESTGGPVTQRTKCYVIEMHPQEN